MAYFATGTEGAAYQERYCLKCRHWCARRDGDPESCPVWEAHFIYNYDECENPDSILHKMIPVEGTKNLQCIFFEKEAPDARD